MKWWKGSLPCQLLLVRNLSARYFSYHVNLKLTRKRTISSFHTCLQEQLRYFYILMHNYSLLMVIVFPATKILWIWYNYTLQQLQGRYLNIDQRRSAGCGEKQRSRMIRNYPTRRSNCPGVKHVTKASCLKTSTSFPWSCVWLYSEPM